LSDVFVEEEEAQTPTTNNSNDDAIRDILSKLLEKDVWQRVETYEYDDQLPYGHGEKSVYIISGYMRLTREEAFAIRYHMGYSSTEDARNVAASFEMFPLSFALSVADSEATYYIESDKYKTK
jgi:hypothetical protein